MIDTQALRNKILDLAMRGKLVEQRPEEGTGEELYQKIQEEKAALVKAGNIKKQKPLPGITEDEKPFEIPKSWKWVRLQDICSKIVDGDHNPPKGETNRTEYRMLSAKNINNDQLVKLEEVRYLSEEIFKQEDERTQVRRGDIFLTIVATLGRSCVYEADYPVCFQRSVCVITTFVNNYFLKRVFDSTYFQQFLNQNASGTAQRGMYLQQLGKVLIPIPPISEQKRIIDRIGNIIPLLNTIQGYQVEYEKNAHVLAIRLLNLAVEGKLVEQQLEEGTGEELYQQIQKEKEKLIKEGKIKKQKPLPEITEDEKPFETPQSWKWVYLGDVFDHNTGKALNGSDDNGVSLTYITTSNLYWDHFELDHLKTMPFTDDEITKCTVHQGDLLVCEGGDIGRSAIWNFDYDMRIQNHIHRLRPYVIIDVRYFYYVMMYLKNNGSIRGRGIGLQGLSSKALHVIRVPLPPLAEQKRIVAKLEELLPLCDRLK